MTMPAPMTIVVVTKGRVHYLAELLASLEQQLAADTPTLIIDNGSTDGTYDFARSWMAQQTTPVAVKRREINSSDLSGWLDTVDEAFDTDWVTFPGDDDIILSGHFADIGRVMKDQPDATCIAAGKQDMAEDGTLLGTRLIPVPESIASKHATVGRMIARPVFAWPALAFRRSALHAEIPSYRFTLDWWVQLNALLAGTAAATGRATVGYRLHHDQEGRMWSNRRKFAEASWMLQHVLSGPEFRQFIADSTPADVEVLLRALREEGGPVYADPVFGLPPLMTLLTSVRCATTSSREVIRLAQQSSNALGITPSIAVLHSWLGDVRQPEDSVSEQPLSPVPASSRLCERAVRVLALAGLKPVVSRNAVVICEHSRTRTTLGGGHIIVVGCRTLSDDAALSERVRDQFEAWMEQSLTYQFGLQPMERRILRSYQALAARVPTRARGWLSNLRGGRASHEHPEGQSD